MSRNAEGPMKLRDVHGQGLATSTALSEYYVPNFITPLEVIRILNAEKVRFMLLGAHGIGGWTGKPRATEDVHIVVGTRGQRKAVRALMAAFPQLQAEDHEVVTRLRDPETKAAVIEVMKANQSLYRDALKYAQPVQAEGQTYLIPSLELALAMKFSAMKSLTRSDDKKHIDAADFIRMVKVNPDIDLKSLAALGELVYNGGGAEIVEKVRQVRAGERLRL